MNLPVPYPISRRMVDDPGYAAAITCPSTQRCCNTCASYPVWLRVIIWLICGVGGVGVGCLGYWGVQKYKARKLSNKSGQTRVSVQLQSTELHDDDLPTPIHPDKDYKMVASKDDNIENENENEDEKEKEQSQESNEDDNDAGKHTE